METTTGNNRKNNDGGERGRFIYFYLFVAVIRNRPGPRLILHRRSRRAHDYYYDSSDKISLGFSKTQDRPYEMHTARSDTRTAYKSCTAGRPPVRVDGRDPRGPTLSSCVVSANAYTPYQDRIVSLAARTSRLLRPTIGRPSRADVWLGGRVPDSRIPPKFIFRVFLFLPFRDVNAPSVRSLVDVTYSSPGSTILFKIR